MTTCYLKTTVTLVIVGNKLTEANILFDKGIQHSFVSTESVKELGLSPTTVQLASFGSTFRSHQKLAVAIVEIKTITRERISISVLIFCTHTDAIFPYLLLHLSGLTVS